MKIKDGYNSKETEIKVICQSNGSIELWIKQRGVDDKDYLSYMTPNELYELYSEVRRAAQDLFNY